MSRGKAVFNMESDNSWVKEKVRALPDAPGVYMFKDKAGQIIYIGKAKSLKKRVSSYFVPCPTRGKKRDNGYFFGKKTQNPRADSQLFSKTRIMASKIFDLDYLLTGSEVQAQLLEAALVKDKQPVYNVSLKDDKSFPFIKISDEEIPVVSISRRRKSETNDHSSYFGPYTSAHLLNGAFKLIRMIFGFRSCRRMPKQPCLYYRLKLCPAPCIGKIGFREYNELIKEIKMFLEFKYVELLDKLNKKMKESASARNFEEAAKIRDQISALNIIGQNKPLISGLDELEDLKNLLRLPKLPEKVEAFDISHISGCQACGSMVSFYKGNPDKDNYRRFRIKTVEGIDDYKMIREVINRRYSRLIRENLPLPDLVLIDGGKSHLLAAYKEISGLGIEIPLVSIAKPDRKNTVFRKSNKENLYTREKRISVKFDSDVPALNLLRRIRDEAHRFAVKYHRLLRKKYLLNQKSNIKN